MSRDHYHAAAEGWARGAALVYAPIAEQLVGRSPVGLAGACVLDVGAGTGVSEAPLRAAGAGFIVGVDLSPGMLVWSRASRPPAVVADVMQMPFGADCFDTAIASFVLNHLVEPIGGLVELARVVRPGGAVLATVYASSSRSENRDAVDLVARAHGWLAPDWYDELKATATPILGAAKPMHAAAVAASLVDVQVAEEDVDVGVTEPRALVDYRFGQAQFAEWRATLGPDGYADARAAAIDAVALTIEPYRPRVVFLAARTA